MGCPKVVALVLLVAVIVIVFARYTRLFWGGYLKGFSDYISEPADLKQEVGTYQQALLVVTPQSALYVP